MSLQLDTFKRLAHSHNPAKKTLRLQQQQQTESMFYYFAYGSCMCPVDLKRTLGEKTHIYVIGPCDTQKNRTGFYCYSSLRNCGVLGIKDPTGSVEGYCISYRGD